MNFGYLKGLETFITGSYFPSYTKVEPDGKYHLGNHVFFFLPQYLTFQIIPYDCLLTNLHCCLSRVSNKQYLIKINLFITKDGTYQTHYRFFPLITQQHKKYQ